MSARNYNFILIVVAIVLAFFLWKSESDYRGVVDLSKRKADTAKYWKDQYGHEHATLQQSVFNRAEADVFYGKKLDSLAKILKTSAGKIVEHTQWIDRYHVSVVPSVDTIYYPADSAGALPTRIKSLVGSFKDPWLTATATLGMNSKIEIFTSDTLNHTRYNKGFFNPKTYIDLSHTSPYVRSYGVTSFAVESAASRLEAVAFAGAGYGVSDLNLKRPVAVFGLGVGYRLFSLGRK